MRRIHVPVTHWINGQCAWAPQSSNPSDVTCWLCREFMREVRKRSEVLNGKTTPPP